jgi:hypothetical protein
VDRAIRTVGKGGIVYCARCGSAATRLEAVLRKFNTGYSACCFGNLLRRPPHRALAQKERK